MILSSSLLFSRRERDRERKARTMADAVDYKLFRELRGHDEDVRDVSHFFLSSSESVSKHDQHQVSSSNASSSSSSSSSSSLLISNTTRVISASRDKSVRIWKEESGGAQVEAVLVGHSDYVTSVNTSPSLEETSEEQENQIKVWVATGSRDKSARIWRLNFAAGGVGGGGGGGFHFTRSECAAILSGHKYQVSSALVLEHQHSSSGEDSSSSSSSLLVATSSLDGIVRLWKVGSKDIEREVETPVQELSGHAGPVLCLCELSDGTLVSGSGDTTIRLWRTTGGSKFECIQVNEDHSDTVRSIAALPNQAAYISASHDTTLRSWSAESGCQKVFAGHSALVYDVKVAPSAAGTILAASASEDCTCRLWDNETGQCLQVLEMPGCVWTADLFLSPTSPMPLLVTGSSDGVARVWAHNIDIEALDDNLIAAFNSSVEERKAEASKAQDAAQGFSPQGLKVEDISVLQQPGVKDGQVKTVRDADGKTYAYQWSVISLKWECVGEVVANPDAPPSGDSSMVAPDKMFDGKHYDYVFDVDIQDGVPPLKLPYNKGENPYEAADRFILANTLPVSYREQIVQFIIQNTGQSGPAPQVPVDPTANIGPYSRSKPPATAYHVPLKKCLTFEQCQKASMLAKISEFNSKCTNGKNLSESHLVCFDKTIDLSLKKSSITTEGNGEILVEGLTLSLSWEKEKIFPIFDMLRIVLLADDSFIAMQRVMESCSLLDVITQALEQPRPAAIELTILRMLSNACTSMPSLVQLLFEPVINNMAGCCKSKSKHVRLAWSTLLLNCAVLVKETLELDSTLLFSYTLQAASDYLDGLDIDSSFRALVGIGTLLNNNKGMCALAADFGLQELVSKAKQLGGKISEVSNDIESLLNM